MNLNRRQQLDILGAVALAAGIIGWIAKPSLAFAWAFLILFGITTVPERLIRWGKEKRRGRREA